MNTLDAERVLAHLIDCVTRSDDDGFVATCQQHPQLIYEHFDEWRHAPRELREDAAQVDLRFRTVLRVAQLFQKAGYPQLMNLLTAAADDDPLTAWNEELARLKDVTGDPVGALAAVEQLLASIDSSGISGPGVLSMRAKARGFQSSILVGLGRDEEARVAVEAALADCAQARDREGIEVYRANLRFLDSRRPVVPEALEAELQILEQMQVAQHRTDLRRYEASTALLQQLLAMSDTVAEIVQRLRPHILSRIGFNDFKLGNLDAAIERLHAAVAACVAAGDHEGAEIYQENLEVLYRARTRNVP